MKIEKLNNNSYRIRQQYKGKRYSVVVPYKPTQKEALKLMSEKMDAPEEVIDTQSFNSYARKHISYLATQGKSPATIRGYESILRNIPDSFLSLRFSDIHSDDVQILINSYQIDRSAKSTANMYGFVRSVINHYNPTCILIVKLPAKDPVSEYEPTTNDIERILEEAKSTRYSVALQLAALGLRRGEVCALLPSDLSDDNILSINKDLVLDNNNNYLVKNSAKTAASNRNILIPQALADEIRAKGCIFDGNPHTINEYLHKCQDKLGIPRFRLHMMRHFCVAYLHKHGFTSEQIMSYGGWSTDNIMKRAYRYNLDPAESQSAIADKLGSLL